MLSSRLLDGSSTAAAGSSLCWTLLNDGEASWPEGTTLRLVGGPVLLQPVIPVPLAQPGQTVELELEVLPTDEPDEQSVAYCLCTEDGRLFGEFIQATIVPKPRPTPQPACVIVASPMDGKENGIEALQGEVKTVEWTLANVGDAPWPEDVTATLIYNTPGFQHIPGCIELPSVAPGMTVVAGVTLLMPEKEGNWKALWAVQSASRPSFGEVLMVEFAVSDFPFMEWMLTDAGYAESVSESSQQDRSCWPYLSTEEIEAARLHGLPDHVLDDLNDARAPCSTAASSDKWDHEPEEAPAPKKALSAVLAFQEHKFFGAGTVDYVEGADSDLATSLGQVSGLGRGDVWLLELAISNDGAEAWPEDTTLACCLGTGMGCSSVPLGAPVPAGETVFVQLELQAPEEPGQTAWVLVAGEACIGKALLLQVF